MLGHKYLGNAQNSLRPRFLSSVYYFWEAGSPVSPLPLGILWFLSGMTVHRALCLQLGSCFEHPFPLLITNP